MIYDKSDFAINIQRVWNRPVTAHLRNDPAAWDARPQLGLQHRAAGRPRISTGGVVHGDHRCRVRGMTGEEAPAGSTTSA